MKRRSSTVVTRHASSFGKEEKEEEEMSFFAWATQKIKDMFVENLPSEAIRDLPKRFMYIFGTLAYILSFGIFCYFTVTGYQIQRKQEFISLNSQDGVCSDVEMAVNGAFYGTSDGIWEGAPNFEYVKSIYVLNLVQYRETFQSYAYQMNEIVLPALRNISARATERNLIGNLMVWLTWKVALRPTVTGDQNYFAMAGDIITVMDRPFLVGSVSGRKGIESGICDVPSVTDFNDQTGVMSAKYNALDFFWTEDCVWNLNPYYLGYDDRDGELFTLELDTVSSIVCLAVNLGVISFDTLSVIYDKKVYYSYGSSFYLETIMVNHNFPGMTPLDCFEKFDNVTGESLGNKFCTLKVGRTIVIPFFADYFGCTSACESMWGYEKDVCDVFDFFIGGLFYNKEPFEPDSSNVITESNNTIVYDLDEENNLAPILDLLSIYTQEEINEFVYIEAFVVAQWSEIYDYSWCNLCSIFAFNTFDLTASPEWHRQVNEYYHSEPRLTCSDTFLPSSDVWMKLSSTPPTDLQQEYYACRATHFDALFNSIGIASGNASALVPLLFALVIPLIYVYLSSSGNMPPPPEFKDSDIDEAVRTLGLMLLRINSGKTSSVSKKNLLFKLTQELAQAAKVTHYYPDSDDDDDDDDPSPSTSHSQVSEAVSSTRRRKGDVFAKTRNVKRTRKKDLVKNPMEPVHKIREGKNANLELELQDSNI